MSQSNEKNRNGRLGDEHDDDEGSSKDVRMIERKSFQTSREWFDLRCFAFPDRRRGPASEERTKLLAVGRIEHATTDPDDARLAVCEQGQRGIIPGRRCESVSGGEFGWEFGQHCHGGHVEHLDGIEVGE